MVMASEVGVSTFPDEEIVQKVGENLRCEPFLMLNKSCEFSIPARLMGQVFSPQILKKTLLRGHIGIAIKC